MDNKFKLHDLAICDCEYECDYTKHCPNYKYFHKKPVVIVKIRTGIYTIKSLEDWYGKCCVEPSRLTKVEGIGKELFNEQRN